MLHHLYMHILSLLFPVVHYFIIISYVHDYLSFTSAFTLITQCLIVLLYPCSVVVVFCCYAPVYITLCSSCNNLQLTISVQSYNTYRYIGDPDVARSLVRSAPAAARPVTARCPMPLLSSRPRNTPHRLSPPLSPQSRSKYLPFGPQPL